MKILHFFKTYYPYSIGGVEQVIFQLAEGCYELGIDCEVLSLSKEGRSFDNKIAHHLSHYSKQDLYIASTGFSISAFSDFKSLVQHADIIHYHFPWPFMDLVALLTKIKKPSVVTYHSDIINQKYLKYLYYPLMKSFLNHVDCIIATSPNYLESSAVLSQYQAKTTVIPIGLNPYPQPKKETLEKWQKQFGNGFFLFVGVIRYYKGLHILIQALENNPLPVVIVGSGPIEKELKAQARKLKIENIHFVGSVSDEDKYALLQLCTCVVFPSHLRSEAFGISLLEGAMSGKPLISSEIGTGTSFININQETGIVIPPSDHIALRDAMNMLWNNPQMAKKLGDNAYKRYLQLFTRTQMLTQYKVIYDRLLSERA